MKETWFQYVVDNRGYWGNGWTLKRLEKVKEAVFNNKDIMNDLMLRHRGDEMNPEQMKAHSEEQFNHCIGNFTCNIHYQMMDEKIIKG